MACTCIPSGCQSSHTKTDVTGVVGETHLSSPKRESITLRIS